MADQQDMGIGELGFSNIVFKRKFRYLFKLSGWCDNAQNYVPWHFVKLAARPNLSIEETEINFLNAKNWIPGKASWETITVTYIDIARSDGLTMMPLYSWLGSAYNFVNHEDGNTKYSQGSKRGDYEATGEIWILDGCGNYLEYWELQHVWPTSVNFGELDYSSSEELTIELTLRYSDVKYTSYCPDEKPTVCCTGCA